MKAIVNTEYGPPDVLRLKEVKKPAPGADEVLVRIHASSANPADWHLIRGEPFIARLEAGLFKPKNTIPGMDIAGTVETVGENVTEFKPGDEVFGDCGWNGGFAEYTCSTEDKLVLKPVNITFEEAAAVPMAAITALQGLRDAGQIKSGQKVLINGASGGVGTYAVQLAKVFGADVTGVCSTRNLELVRSLGADHVIDYTQQDFAQNTPGYDLILDNVGNRPVAGYKPALSRSGACVIVGFSSLGLLFQHMILGPLSSMTGSQRIRLMGTARTNKKDLAFLQGLLAAGKVKSVIDRCYPLSETAEATRYLEAGRARGKVIITIT